MPTMPTTPPTPPQRRITPAELRTWRTFIDTTTDLRRILAAQLLHDTSLSAADYQVLLALHEADHHHLRSSTLAATIDWERSRLSHHLTRMERRDLIRRDNCATDNRGAEVVLTENGADLFRRATAPHMRAIKDTFIDALTPTQLDNLADILDSLKQHLTTRP